jgi:hypothetical protein
MLFLRISRQGLALLMTVMGWFAIDALCFRTRLYTSILEPDSSAGLLELVLNREQRAQERYGANLIVTLGDSRFAYYPRVANSLTPRTGFAFRHAGVAGTDVRTWYYLLRDLDPARQRYHAIVLGLDDYDDEDGPYDVADDLATLHYVVARLRFRDILSFTRSFHDPMAQWNAFRGSLLKGTVLQQDILAFFSHPLKRVEYVRAARRSYEDWTYGFVETNRNVTGLKIDWPSLTATVPPGNDALRDQLTRFVLYRPYAQTGKRNLFRREWFGRLIDVYRGSRTKLVFLRLPRGPFPRPDHLVAKHRGAVREYASLPGVVVMNEHTFDSLEIPELFKDAFHLNDAGCARFAAMMAEQVSAAVR